MSASGPSGPLVSNFEWPLKTGFTVCLKNDITCNKF